ncbi:MAG: membrane lipoprotein lipid attachment site-containing protein [Rhodobacteraceae bacterium]|nr:membrane lipoprotein lipid attachment site-containing protein [Paracoccaceae bacterium]
MKRIFIGFLITAALSACSVDPQAAADRRQSLIQHIFPAPADQRGLHLVFPIESFGYYSSMLIVFFPNEVSEGTVRNVSGVWRAPGFQLDGGKFQGRSSSSRLAG